MKNNSSWFKSFGRHDSFQQIVFEKKKKNSKPFDFINLTPDFNSIFLMSLASGFAYIFPACNVNHWIMIQFKDNTVRRWLIS